MKKGIAFLLFYQLFLGPVRAQNFPVYELQHSGDSSKYINILLMGDGYTLAQFNDYWDNATSFVNYFFSQSPLKEYKNYFNVWVMFIPSNQSGATHPNNITSYPSCPCPGTASCSPDNCIDQCTIVPLLNSDTYLKCSFDQSNIHRYIQPTEMNNLTAVLAQFGNYDFVNIISNTPFYGGSGNPGTSDPVSTSTLEANANEIAVHEIGHNFADLADEYWSGFPIERRRNQTMESDPNIIKWKNWIGANGIGIYPYGTTGTPALWFKPHQNCKMQFLAADFCSVCKEAIIEKIHELVDKNVIVEYSPSNSAPLSTTGQYIDFSLDDLMKPDPNTLKIEWKLDGEVQSEFNNLESIRIDLQFLPCDKDTLTVVVTDVTSMVRVDDPSTPDINEHSVLHKDSVIWIFDKSTNYKYESISGIIYKTPDIPVFQTNNFRNLEVDEKNNIWVGSSGSGVYMYDGCEWDSAYNHNIMAGYVVRAMRRDPSNGNIWIGMSKTIPCLGWYGGVFAYTDKNTYTAYIPTDEDPDEFNYAGLTSSVVRCLDFNKSSGDSWAGCTQSICFPGTADHRGGLCGMRDGNYSDLKLGMPRMDINPLADGIDWSVTALTSAPDGKVYAGIGRSCDGSDCIDPYILVRLPIVNELGFWEKITSDNTPVLPFSTESHTFSIRALFYDSNNRLWVGGELNGLGVRKSDGEWVFLKSPRIPYLENAIVNFDAISEGPDGAIYVGTNNGLLKFKGDDVTLACNWSSLDITGISYPQSIFSIRFDQNGIMWLATKDGVFSSDERTCLEAIECGKSDGCDGENNGYVCIDATGGTPPYLGTETYTGLAPGEHTFTVTDNVGTTAEITITINEPPQLVAYYTNLTAADCDGGSITINAIGGTPPYSGDYGDMNGLEAGIHTFTVTDANNCSSDVTTLIPASAGPLLICDPVTYPVVNNVSCYGANNGSVSFKIIGGTPPYGGDATTQNNLASGTYTFTVHDAVGSTASVTVTISEPDPIAPDAGADQTICNATPSQITLTGSVLPPSTTGHWVDLTGTTVFTPSDTVPEVTIADYHAGNNRYSWQITCGANTYSDEVNVYAAQLSSIDGLRIEASVNGLPVSDLSDIQMCVGESITFTRTGGQAGEVSGYFHWYEAFCDNARSGFDSSNGVIDAITVTPASNTSYYIAARSTCNVSECIEIARVTVHPSIAEVCNGFDDNCDGNVDEGCGSFTYYADADDDGFGNLHRTFSTNDVAPPIGYVVDNTDCDDTPVSGLTIHPGATEICNGIDDDCDGLIDDADPSITGQPTYYIDFDEDGFGDKNDIGVTSCEPPTSRITAVVTNNTDCDDGDAAINPNASEACNGIDDNCNGYIDEGVQTVFYLDSDGDGFGTSSSSLLACTAPLGYVLDNTDCNDAEITIHPGAAETCNSIDDDCNGTIDDGLTFVFYYPDVDLDSYGDKYAAGVSSCSPIAGKIKDHSDCNDIDQDVNPGASEACNGIDDNCSGNIDEGVQTTFYLDEDADGFGNLTSSVQACTQPPGYVVDNTDCDDSKPSVYPEASETCDTIDNDCDGFIDEGVQLTFYRDADLDGFGNPLITTLACSVPAGYVADNTDCNDGSASAHPGGTEICNGIDDNCSGIIDEDVKTLFYLDADGDGFGNPAITDLACSALPGFISDNTDCNDGNAAAYPGATEICNGLDDNCDGLTDPSCDLDGDGFTISAGDCNDGNPAVNPGATETCNGLDDNCNGSIDEGLLLTFYRDADGDGFGNAGITSMECTSPPGYVSNNTDCNDGNAAMNPGATETCNSIDDNCNGTIDEGCDGDGDGYTIATGDCNDGNPNVHPGATEVCNGIDDNCNGTVDEGTTLSTFYRDADGDGFGNSATSVLACSAPSGYVSNSTDCNDGNGAIYPGAFELCNGIDDNCNGTVDDNCCPPGGQTTTSITATGARFNWTIFPSVLGYKVQFRKTGAVPWTSGTITSNIGFYNATGLKLNTTYEWQVSTQCTGGRKPTYSSFSSSTVFSTLATRMQDESITEEATGIFIFPNPTDGTATLIFTSQNPGTFKLEVSEMTGRVVIDKVVDASEGENSITINLGQYSSGVYFILLNSLSEGTRRGKLIKE